jgi:hypothetical protein
MNVLEWRRRRMIVLRCWARGAMGLSAAMLTLGTATAACADGIMLPPDVQARLHQQSYVSEPEQKAAVLYRNGVEDLIISPTFAGPVERFAWVIPVPSRPKVDKVDGALFHELGKLAFPMPAALPGPADRSGKVAGVAVLERKQVGAYDVAVLEATDSQALYRWLRANKFAVQPAAKERLGQHIAEKWTFVAARVNVPRAARALATGTLAPIRLTFRTAEPIYPLRLSGANPEPFLVLVYYIVPAKADTKPPAIKVDGPTSGWEDNLTPVFQSKADPARSLCEGDVMWVSTGVTRTARMPASSTPRARRDCSG